MVVLNESYTLYGDERPIRAVKISFSANRRKVFKVDFLVKTEDIDSVIEKLEEFDLIGVKKDEEGIYEIRRDKSGNCHVPVNIEVFRRDFEKIEKALSGEFIDEEMFKECRRVLIASDRRNGLAGQNKNRYRDLNDFIEDSFYEDKWASNTEQLMFATEKKRFVNRVFEQPAAYLASGTALICNTPLLSLILGDKETQQNWKDNPIGMAIFTIAVLAATVFSARWSWRAGDKEKLLGREHNFLNDELRRREQAGQSKSREFGV